MIVYSFNMLRYLQDAGLPVRSYMGMGRRITTSEALTATQKVTLLKSVYNIDATEETADRYLTETEIPG